MAIQFWVSRQQDATTTNRILDEIALGEKYLKAAGESRFYRSRRVDGVIGATIRACNHVLGMSGSFKNGCLYREAGLAEFWSKRNGESVVCDHAVPVSELVRRYHKENVPLQILAFSPVVRITQSSNEELTQNGYAKKGHKSGFPLFRYSLVGVSIVTHKGDEIDAAKWTDDDHWTLMKDTTELKDVIDGLPELSKRIKSIKSIVGGEGALPGSGK